MKMISIQVPVRDLAQAVADEIAASKGKNNRAALIAAHMGLPGVNEAIAAIIAATDKVENSQHSRGENAALNELFKSAKQLRMAVRLARTVEKETTQ